MSNTLIFIFNTLYCTWVLMSLLLTLRYLYLLLYLYLESSGTQLFTGHVQVCIFWALGTVTLYPLWVRTLLFTGTSRLTVLIIFILWSSLDSFSYNIWLIGHFSSWHNLLIIGVDNCLSSVIDYYWQHWPNMTCFLTFLVRTHLELHWSPFLLVCL